MVMSLGKNSVPLSIKYLNKLSIRRVVMLCDDDRAYCHTLYYLLTVGIVIFGLASAYSAARVMYLLHCLSNSNESDYVIVNY